MSWFRKRHLVQRAVRVSKALTQTKNIACDWRANEKYFEKKISEEYEK